MNRWISRGMGGSWKLVLSSLHKVKFWVRVSRHPSKFLNGRHKQRSGQHTLARQQKYKKLTLSCSACVSVDGSCGRREILWWECYCDCVTVKLVSYDDLYYISLRYSVPSSVSEYLSWAATSSDTHIPWSHPFPRFNPYSFRPYVRAPSYGAISNVQCASHTFMNGVSVKEQWYAYLTSNHLKYIKSRIMRPRIIVHCSR